MLALFFKKNKIFIMIVVVASLIIQAITIAYIYISTLALNEIIKENKDFIKFTIYISIIVALVIFSAFLKWIFTNFKNKNIQNNAFLIKKIIANNIFNFNYHEFNKKDSSLYLAWFNNDTWMMERWIGTFYSLIEQVISFVLTMIFVFTLSWIVGLITLFSSIMLIFLTSLFSRTWSKISFSFSSLNEEFNSNIVKILSKFSVFLFFLRMKKMITFINEIIEDYKNQNWKLQLKIILIMFIINLILVLTNIIGTLAPILLAFNNIIKELPIVFSIIIYNLSIFEIVNNAMGLVSSTIGDIVIFKKHKLRDNNLDNMYSNKIFHNLILENVNFSYKNNKAILKDINLLIEKNKKYALVGPSGSGKSTLIKLILKLENNWKGKILINHKEYTNCFDYIAYMDSKNFVFNDTIINNLTLWDENLKNDAINFLKQFHVEKNYEQIISNDTGSISEGEKQRICLIRTLLSNKKFLILDEAISNLDKISKNIILKILLERKDLTLILISHHLNKEQFSLFDKVIEIDKINLMV